MRRERWIARATGPIGAAALLAVHLALALASSRHDSAAFDEVVFVTGAVSHVATGDYRLNPDGGQLVQRWAGLPLVLGGARFPDLEQPAWWTSDGWRLGHQVFYEVGNDPRVLLLRGRAMTSLLSVALGLVVWLWARALFGPWGGLLALSLHAFSPAFLAHGRLVTADVAAALFLLAGTWACWRTMQRVSARTLAASCAAVTLALLAKMSGVLLLPIAGLMLVVVLASRRPLVLALGAEREVKGALRKLGVLVPVLLLHAAVAVACIWMTFGFRYEAFLHSQPGRDVLRDGGWDAMGDAGLRSAPVRFAREHHLLPEGWLFGYQFVVKFSNVRQAYFHGRYSMTGWWWFFPATFLLKTPLATLALLAVALAALGAGLARRRASPKEWPGSLPGTAARDPIELVPLLALLVVYVATSVTTPLNIGLRHFLPAIAPMFVLAGAVAWVLPRHRLAPAAVLALAVLGASDALLAYPDYIAYFNPVAGSPAHRWRWLVDSSLDWGQGLPSLREELESRREHGSSAPAYLAYFGAADPIAEGLDVTLLPGYRGIL